VCEVESVDCGHQCDGPQSPCYPLPLVLLPLTVRRSECQHDDLREQEGGDEDRKRRRLRREREEEDSKEMIGKMKPANTETTQMTAMVNRGNMKRRGRDRGRRGGEMGRQEGAGNQRLLSVRTAKSSIGVVVKAVSECSSRKRTSSRMKKMMMKRERRRRRGAKTPPQCGCR